VQSVDPVGAGDVASVTGFTDGASAQWAGARHLLTEDVQDGLVLQGVTFVNPFKRANDRLIGEILPSS
jgi:hypothetical protein